MTEQSLKATSISAYIWNPYSRSYSLAAGGKTIDTDGVRKIVDELRKGTNERLTEAAKELQSGALTNLTQWSLDFKDELKNLYISTHVLARGGLEEMDNSSWGMLGQSLREQYDYINSFVRDIENANIGVKDPETGEVVVRDSGIPELGDDFLNRVDLYTDSAWGAQGELENVFLDRERDLGSMERLVLGDDVKKHCDDCLEDSDLGFQPAGVLRDLGDRECGPGCGCTIEFENEELNSLADSFGGELTSGEEKSIKGGPGSGNFGHSGIPGQVGGSGSGGSDIRQATDDDVDKAVILAESNEGDSRIEEIALALTEKDEQGIQAFVIDQGNKLTGAISFKDHGRDGIEIRHLGSISKGSGSNLVKEVESKARDLGTTRIFLISAKSAEGFWEKQGYKDSTGNGIYEKHLLTKAS